MGETHDEDPPCLCPRPRNPLQRFAHYSRTKRPPVEAAPMRPLPYPRGSRDCPRGLRCERPVNPPTYLQCPPVSSNPCHYGLPVSATSEQLPPVVRESGEVRALLAHRRQARDATYRWGPLPPLRGNSTGEASEASNGAAIPGTTGFPIVGRFRKTKRPQASDASVEASAPPGSPCLANGIRGSRDPNGRAPAGRGGAPGRSRDPYLEPRRFRVLALRCSRFFGGGWAANRPCSKLNFPVGTRYLLTPPQN